LGLTSLRWPVACRRPAARAAGNGIARFNPVNWAASAGRLAVGGHAAWGTVGGYAAFLALAVAVTAAASTRAFRAYQRSI